MDLLNYRILNNTLIVWALSALLWAGSAGLLIGCKYILAWLLGRKSEAVGTKLLPMLAGAIRKTNIFLLIVIAVYIGSQILILPVTARRVIDVVALLAALMQAGIWGGILITAGLKKIILKEEDQASVSGMSVISVLGRLIVWSVVLLLFLDNLGFDITALVAGLGIGGIAIGLAMQNILADLFASLSIVLDKPFEIGDFIIVGDLMGSVERIGLKTTRIRSLSGEQLVFSNNDLLTSRIRNYKRMNERRALFSFGVVYGIAPERLEKIPGLVREIIESVENTRFDRAHFKEYADFSLDFEVVYYVLLPDYNLFMDIQQKINLSIYKRFREEGIEFAFPTSTIHIAKGSAS